MMKMYLQKVISKNLEEKKNFVDVLKVTDENSRIRIRIRNTDLFYACIYTISIISIVFC
jgi:hypothetical protein